MFLVAATPPHTQRIQNYHLLWPSFAGRQYNKSNYHGQLNVHSACNTTTPVSQRIHHCHFQLQFTMFQGTFVGCVRERLYRVPTYGPTQRALHFYGLLNNRGC